MNRTTHQPTAFFSPKNFSQLDKKILDELSDGQWHQETKIKKEIGESNIINSLKKMEDDGFLLAGMNNSFRVRANILDEWRAHTDFEKKDIPRYLPRYFGGILEDDGWAMAELKNYDLIHFRTNGNISKADVEEIINYKGLVSQVTRSEDGLYRIFVKDSGDETYQTIKKTVFDTPDKSFSGVRLEKNVKRRDLKDLDRNFLSDLCKYYGEFSHVLLKKNMSSVTKHITDPDDVQQQIYLWIIDAVQRYDHTTSIPFAAYLGKMLKNWVFNLNRQSFGRSAADVELKHSRAATLFRNEHNREPSIEELAGVLNEDVDIIRNEKISIHSVSNIRTMGTIDSDETIVQVVASENTHGRIEEQTHQYLLSSSITDSALRDENVNPNIIGWLNSYHNTWGNTKNKKFLPQSPSKDVEKATSTLYEKAKNKLKDSGAY